jgi:hypothetical protein
MIYSLALLASAALAQNCVYAPPQFHMTDNNLQGNFTLALDSQPKGDVTVFMSAPGLSFDKCRIVFTQQNYLDPVIVNVAGVPVFSGATSASFNVTARIFTSPTNFTDTTYNVQREVESAGTYSSLGDPHFTTLDGYAFSQQSIGYKSLFWHPVFLITI